MTSPAPLKRSINSLQAGRGIAALAVVLVHAACAARDFGGQYAGYDIFRQGYLGVDFFFVLSGFIIYHSTVGRDRTLKEYVTARIKRVYLPYWLVGIAIALAYVAFPGVSAVSRAWGWLPTLTLAPVDTNTALSVAWTLKHEVLFYALFGLFYFGRCLLLGLSAWALAIIFYGQHLAFLQINLEFLMGIGAAVLYRRGLAHSLLFVAAGIFGFVWFAQGADAQHRLWIGAMFACISAALAQLEAEGRVTVSSPMVLLGAASYSLYLIHEPVVSACARMLSSSWAILFVSTGFSMVGGFAYHFGVERRSIGTSTSAKLIITPSRRRNM